MISGFAHIFIIIQTLASIYNFGKSAQCRKDMLRNAGSIVSQKNKVKWIIIFFEVKIRTMP